MRILLLSDSTVYNVGCIVDVSEIPTAYEGVLLDLCSEIVKGHCVVTSS
jgi:hypothetical protein